MREESNEIKRESRTNENSRVLRHLNEDLKYDDLEINEENEKKDENVKNEEQENARETREQRRKNKRKINFQKIFIFISLIFIMSCVIYYGLRFIKLYKENSKTEETKQIADNIKDDNANNKNFKNIKGDYYFEGKKVNNYVKYSNLLWRIIKVDKHGNVTIALNENITSQAKKLADFKQTNVYEWLNKTESEYSGLFQNILNDIPQYLTYTDECNDKIDDTKNITCKKQTKEIYITIPSLNDYVNTGSSNSFLNNNSYYYLINNGSKNVWCIDNEGKISTSKGDDIIGIKPVITIKNLTKLKSGNGSLENPYEFEEQSPSLIGSYVKIDNDMWRVYKESGENVNLVLDSFISVNSIEPEYKYSKVGHTFNTKEVGSLANYLNTRYLNGLKYKNILEDFEMSNGKYINYDYKEVLKEKVITKVGLLTVGDIIFDRESTGFYLGSSPQEVENMMHIYQGNGKIESQSIMQQEKIIPTISIKKSLIKEYGTKEKPCEVSYE